MTMTVALTSSTSFGPLRGAIDRGVVVFRGIPYARAPIGDLRFGPPQRPDSWTGVRDATTFGPPPLQLPSPVNGRAAPDNMSEDCLYLNIWTPALDGASRPVLVWLHGGAFTVGAGSLPTYHGARLAARGDVVVVTINYRLGLFGWLRGIDLCGNSLPTTGNEGLLDQIAALQWIKDEIAAFGGDPHNVTVVGQSAGATSIYAMLSMPQTRGLLHKAILQSGTDLFHPPSAANRVAEDVLEALAVPPRDARRLRDVPAAQLLEVQARVTPRSRGIAYRLVADGMDLPPDPVAAVATGTAAGIPLLVGSNLEEQKFYSRLDPDAEHLTDDGLLERLADARTNVQAGDDARFAPSEAIELYRRERAARGERATAPELWDAMMSDRRFRVPMMRLAEHQSAHCSQTFAYLFTWRSPAWNGKLGAGHAVEVPFLFGTLDTPGEAGEIAGVDSETQALSTRMQDAWIAFARTGNPATRDLPDWEPYTSSRRNTMLLGTTCRAVDAPYESERHFWTNAV